MTENKSLMRKTKQELVNIILRKDDVASTLQNEINALKEQIAGKDTYMDSKNQYVNRLKEEVVKLNAVVQTKVELINDANLSIKEREKELSELNSQIADLQDSYDEYASRMIEMNNITIRWKAISLVMTIVAIAAVIMTIVIWM